MDDKEKQKAQRKKQKINAKSAALDSNDNLTDEEKAVLKSIVRLRIDQNISQTELGKTIKVHQTAVCRIETGEQKISIPQLVALSKKYSINSFGPIKIRLKKE